MWESKSIQTKLPVFKEIAPIAEDGRASFSVRYVKIFPGQNSPVEALFAKLIMNEKLIMALIECAIKI